ncbi:MAG: class I SAM-dependent methyltransferase [Patescibacteria group bacterium]|jgi:ubiquinone/menaquinone biosynthesis C-methylase UbiE
MRRGSQFETSDVEIESAKPRRIFVDLGSGKIPSAFWGDREFKDNDYYVGVENRREMIESALLSGDIVHNKENFKRTGKNILFVNGDARGPLPFADTSVDEVFLGNIFGEFAIKSVDGFLAEAKRILKPDGVLIVFETHTPHVTKDWRDSEGSEHIVEKFGFKKVKEVGMSDPEFQKEVSAYDNFHEPSDGSFVLYFCKKKQ